MLTKEQLQNHVEKCLLWKRMIHAEPDYLSRVITGDESWIYHNDPAKKQKISVWKHTITKKSLQKKCARQN